MRIHIGFMAEELSAKLKITLLQPGVSVIIITRDDVREGFLFEQPLARFQGVKEAIESYQYGMTFADPPSTNTPIQVKSLITHLEKEFIFDLEDFRLPQKSKLTGNRAKLTVIFTNPNLPFTDVYVQFPEMGFQSTLAPLLCKKLFKGLFSFLKPTLSPNESFVFDAFGAGGSMNPDLPPGSMDRIMAVLNIRTSLEKLNSKGIKSRIDFRPMDLSNKVRFAEYSLEAKRDMESNEVTQKTLEMQEASRVYFLKQKQILDRIDPSTQYRNFLINKELTYGELTKRVAHAINTPKPALDKAGLFTSTEVLLPDASEHQLSTLTQFLEEINSLHIKHLDGLLTHLKDMSDLPPLIKNLLPHSVSIAASMFVDDAMKSVGYRLLGKKAASVNMEDDLVIKVNKYSKTLLQELFPESKVEFYCFRVH